MCDMSDSTSHSVAESERERELTRAAAAASEPVFTKIWSNPEDDIYDAL